MAKNPAPRWLFAEDKDGNRQFILHTKTPGFYAEITDESQLSGFEYALKNGQTLSEFVWFDNPPAGKDLELLLEVADDALEQYDSELELPIHTCLRCSREWIPRAPDRPKVCPGCHSPYWDKPRRR